MKRAGYLPLRRAVLACARAADTVIATDRMLEPVVRTHLRVSPDRIAVIPNALDLHWLDRLATPADGARVRQAASIRPDELVLLSVGRLEANKGFHDAGGGAWRAARAWHPPSGWTMALGGDWRWAVSQALEQAVAEAGIGGNTHLLGRIDDKELHARYEAASLFVHPSLYEGSSLVTLEAMAHRRAVVATTAGGLPDKVRPGVNGWLVAPGDPSALAAAISGALGDPLRLATMGAAGRAIVEGEFSWEAAGRATLELYRRLLS